MILSYVDTYLARYVSFHVSDITTAFNELFTVLFYGQGVWLGLLLLLMLMLGISIKYPRAGLLMLPVSVFLGVDYLGHDLGWHSLIMWLASVFILLDLAYALHKKEGGR